MTETISRIALKRSAEGKRTRIPAVRSLAANEGDVSGSDSSSLASRVSQSQRKSRGRPRGRGQRGPRGGGRGGRGGSKTKGGSKQAQKGKSDLPDPRATLKRERNDSSSDSSDQFEPRNRHQPRKLRSRPN